MAVGEVKLPSGDCPGSCTSHSYLPLNTNIAIASVGAQVESVHRKIGLRI